MNDPTYNLREIAAVPTWQLAFDLSEIRNDNAPIGWGTYIPTAKCLLSLYEMRRKPQNTRLEEKERNSIDTAPKP